MTKKEKGSIPDKQKVERTSKSCGRPKHKHKRIYVGMSFPLPVYEKLKAIAKDKQEQDGKFCCVPKLLRISVTEKYLSDDQLKLFK